MALLPPFRRATAGLLLSGLLVGCSDFAAYRYASRGQAVVLTEGAPHPAARLAIDTPPTHFVAAAAEVPALPANFVPAPEQAPARSTPPTTTGEPLRRLADRATERFAGIDSYIVRLKRREAINGKVGPEEVLLCKFRKEPFSVAFKWLGSEGKGREVVYVKGQHQGKIHTLTAAGDVPFMPGGSRFSIAPDSSLVRSKCRHPIDEAGLGSVIHNFAALVAQAERHDTKQGTLKYLGPIQRPEYPQPVETVEQTIAPGGESLLPGGGRRLWHFDPSLGLPVLIVTYDESGREVEYYCHDRFALPVRLDDDDFNPEKLWKTKS